MSDNTPLNSGTGGSVMRDIDKGGVKTAVIAFDVGGAGAEVLADGSTPAKSLPFRRVDLKVTGSNITTPDVTNSNAPSENGTPNNTARTTGSFAAFAVPDGAQTCVITLGGSGSGIYVCERSNDSTNGADGGWVAAYGKVAGVAAAADYYGYGLSVGRSFIVDVTGADYVRVANLFGAGLATTVKAKFSMAVSGLALRGSLPQGTPSNPLGMVRLGDGNAIVGFNSTATLAAGGVYTSAWTDVTDFAILQVSVYASHASAVDGLQIQQSSDGVSPDFPDLYTVPAATGKTFNTGRQAQYFRVVYTNGATAQTAFRLQAIFGKHGSKDSSIRPQDSRSNDNDMTEATAHVMGYDAAGNQWHRMRGSIANGLVVDNSRDQDVFLTGQGSQTALNQNILLAAAGTGWLDTFGMRSIAMTIAAATGTVTAGAVTFETTNDPSGATAASPLTLFDPAITSNATSSTQTIAAATVYHRVGNLPMRYIRARISTALTGTTTGLQALTLLRPTTYAPSNPTVNLAAGTQAFGSTNINAGTANMGGVVPRNVATTNGYTRTPFTSAASTNGTVIKNSAGTLVRFRLRNIAAYSVFIRFYNSTTVTVGTTTPAFPDIEIPAGGTISEDYVDGGEFFSTGICFSATKLTGNTDTTAIAVGDLRGFFTFI